MTTIPPLTVTLAGATGNLGKPVLRALLEHFNVVVLSRIGGKSTKLGSHPRLTICEVDFSSAGPIERVLSKHGVKVVVSCLATLAIGAQKPLIKASVKACVARFIPAEFGMDSLNPFCAQLPVCVPKVDTARYLQGLAQKNPCFSWTGVANGLFLDWGIRKGFIVDLANHGATLYNGGDVKFSASTLSDVAHAVVRVIEHQPETANRLVYVHSAVVTQNQLISYAKDIDGRAWETSDASTADILEESLELFRSGADEMGAMDGFCSVAMWDPAYGGDFSDKIDNTLLGIPLKSEQEVKGIVAECLEETTSGGR